METNEKRWNFRKREVDYTLYLCTDRGALQNGTTLVAAVEAAILGGASLVQLREKECASRTFYEVARRVKEVTTKYRVPLIINDRLDIALAVDAEGVHLGQSDLPCRIAREILGPDKIIGVTAKTVDCARAAEADGADYLGTGAAFPTQSKFGAAVISHADIRAVCDAVDIPVVAIGGIAEENAKELKDTGIAGVCVISGILAQADVREAAKSIRAQVARWCAKERRAE